MTSTAQAPRGCADPLDVVYDVGLLDLDGVVYLGGSAIPGAAEALRSAEAAGMRLAYVTNNAFRTPAAIAALLTSFGVPAAPDDVVTSAQAAARMVAERLPAGAPVLVVGGSGLRQAVRHQGLRPVTTAADRPQAVIQGYSPDISYPMLAEGGLAVAAGALFVASNGDLTLPSRRGRQPGNGSLVQVIATATGIRPLVAGKPEPPLHRESVLRTGAKHPLIVGDRLDTDIEAGSRVGADTMLVLTGVTSPDEAVLAPPSQRPTYLAENLTGLLEPHPAVTSQDDRFGCGGWTARWDTDRLELTGDGKRIDGLRALCAAAWADGRAARAADGRAARAADGHAAGGADGRASGAADGQLTGEAVRAALRRLEDARLFRQLTAAVGGGPCMLSGMPGRAAREHGNRTGAAATMLRVFCPSCCC